MINFFNYIQLNSDINLNSRLSQSCLKAKISKTSLKTNESVIKIKERKFIRCPKKFLMTYFREINMNQLICI
jgi:hypothetical protein